ncbi:ceramidase domain-containing protein [Cognatilysobacter lacus]|uniref:Ceramidase n=1 Tax=Cognatilysobacter lacus TaxID=1643323 RepID=A0A5D8Z519_9GAMM|nr:ceramidase domain-containing protein [Lysobacter lacus]TZF89740.1 ceramidase [Lysobacter lacus]
MPRLVLTRVLLLAATFAAIVALALHGPIPQDPDYHRFADSRVVAGIPNFWNVLSNVPFLLVGIYGLLRVPRLEFGRTRAGYIALCIGIACVALGSGAYHWAPSNATLVGDRLPMTIAFMAFFALLLDERVVADPRRLGLVALLLLGVASVAYWNLTERLGAGDLRPYVLVQFLPLLLVPLILLLRPSRWLDTRWLVLALVGYAAAKALEHFDAQIFAMSGVVSGHTLKHVVAAASAACILRAVPARAAAQPSSVNQSRGRR